MAHGCAAGRRPAAANRTSLVLLGAVLAQACAAPALPEPPAPEAEVSAELGAERDTRAVGSMSDLMVKVIYPASDAIFYITTRTPSTSAEWTELEGTALMLAESANLLMMPSRARGREGWMTDAKLLLDAGEAAFWAAKERDVEALTELNDQLYQSCVQCHQNYRPGYGRRRASAPGVGSRGPIAAGTPAHRRP